MPRILDAVTINGGEYEAGCAPKKKYGILRLLNESCLATILKQS